jgi:hypothetical protein
MIAPFMPCTGEDLRAGARQLMLVPAVDLRPSICRRQPAVVSLPWSACRRSLPP